MSNLATQICSCLIWLSCSYFTACTDTANRLLNTAANLSLNTATNPKISLACVSSATQESTARLLRFEKSEPHMGVLVRIILYSPDKSTAAAAFAAAFRRVEELEERLSTYRPDSEVTQLKGLPACRRRVVSQDLWDLLKRSEEISRLSAGAFDVTVSPAIELWRKSQDTKRLPAVSELQAIRSSVGYQHVALNAADRSVCFAVAGMSLNFGGIGKGFAADEALAKLCAQGVTRALVDVGGDLAVGAPPPDTLGWRVGVSQLSPRDPPQHYIVVSRCGVATSGDALQFVEIGNVRYSHIIDPQTGLGLTHPCGVTVVAQTATRADALASAMCVLGLPGAVELASKSGVHVMGSVAGETGAVHFRSPGFPQLEELAP